MKWEYKITKSGYLTIDLDANEVGKDGWEMCGIVTSTANTILVFKRPIYDRKEKNNKEN